MSAEKKSFDSALFESDNIWGILWKVAPPVMLAQLIQALYNIVDSYFVGKYSADGLTALSVVYPIQLAMTALSVGTGVGVNTRMARLYAEGKVKEADDTAGTGTVLAVITWAVFALITGVCMRPYAATSVQSSQALEDAVTYGTIVCVGSLGIFLESIWTKVHQAGGNMRLPMVAQICGAVTNIIFDPLLIFGIGPFPETGVAGAAAATVAGQIVAAVITGISGWRRPPKREVRRVCASQIYRLGYPSILMQMLYTVYIVALNVILAGFSDAAVTVLGLYYKLQTFFFIPLMGLETCIVPLLSYNFGAGSYGRCRRIFKDCLLACVLFMLIGVACFEGIPGPMIRIFSDSAEVLEIGKTGFRIIGLSFVPASFSLLTPTFFQAIGGAKRSAALSLIRQVFCLIPLFWLFSRLSLNASWIAFPVSEIIAGTIGMILYARQVRSWERAIGKQ